MVSRSSISPSAVPVLLLLFLILLATYPAPAAAQPSGFGLYGRSSTYIQGFVRPAGNETMQYIPFYELVDLNVRRLGVDGLSLHTSLWGLVDFVDRQDRYRASGDVTTLYVSYRAPDEGPLRALRGLEVAAGRQFVAFGSTVLEQLDGGKIHYLHSSGLEAGVFGGAISGTRVAFMPWPSLDDRYPYGNNWLVGGRLGFVDLGHLSAGVSYVHRRYHDEIADNDISVDVNYLPIAMLDISGSAIMSLEALRPKEGRGTVGIDVGHGLALNLGYRYSSPDLYVPRSSIFAVFSEEKFHEANLDIGWKATRVLSFDAGYGRRFYAAAKDGRDSFEGANRVSARGVLRYGPERAGRLLAEVERVEGPSIVVSENTGGGRAATRFRAATRIPLFFANRIWSIIADIDLFVLDESVRGTQLSVTGGGFLEVPLWPTIRLMAGGTGGTSPLLTKAGSFLARLTWEFDSSSSDVQVQRGRVQ